MLVDVDVGVMDGVGVPVAVRVGVAVEVGVGVAVGTVLIVYVSITRPVREINWKVMYVSLASMSNAP